MKISLFLLILVCYTTSTLAQTGNCKFTVKGKLVDNAQSPVIGQAVELKYKTFQKASFKAVSKETGEDGSFEFCITETESPSEIEIEIRRVSCRDFRKKIVKPFRVYDFKTIKLIEKDRVETPVPTDNIDNEALNATGQTSIGRALHYLSPAFNSTTQPISDASAHFDPTDFRNLGASRTLILVNGVRKNLSSVIPVNDVPNKGEVGADIRAIPMAAIENVKIERQEATTLYGSDAIAGIIDFRLKGYLPKLLAKAYSGATVKGDGLNYGLDLNKSFRIGSRGFLTATYSFLEQKEVNRANQLGYDSLFVEGNKLEWKKWIQNNPRLGMHIGEPNMTTNTIFYNAELPFSENSDDKFYSFGGLTYRSTQSYALYRAPYWIKDPNRIFSTADSSYNGFQPTFESGVTDKFFVFGVNGRLKQSDVSQVEYDINQTIGSNDADFSVNNSYNSSLGKNSPTSFKVGGNTFAMNNTKFNLEYNYNNDLRFKVGGEFRTEKYILKAGEENSYTGEGTISFPGIQPKNAINANRNNFGGFVQLVYDNFTINRSRENERKIMLLDGSIRYEKYNDFRSATAYKVSTLIRCIDNDKMKWVLRGSLSTGFRAPSLHQLNYGKIQTVISGSTISNRGIFNRSSPILRELQVKKLENETSKSFSFGTALDWEVNELNRISFAADYYNTVINNRIVFSSSIEDTINNQGATNIVKQILKQNNITGLNFFLNAVNTETSGLDIMLKYKRELSNDGRLEINFVSNVSLSNKVIGLVATPAPIQAAKVIVFDRKEEGRLLYARPDNKTFLTAIYSKLDKWRIAVNGSYFGKVKWQHPKDSNKDQVFSGRMLFNFFAEYRFNETVSLNFSINNIAKNPYPDVLDPNGLDAKEDPTTTVGGRFLYYREANQFGISGTTYLANLIMRL